MQVLLRRLPIETYVIAFTVALWVALSLATPNFLTEINISNLMRQTPIAAIETILLPPPWHRGRILLIGDAAHTTTPHHAQGAAMAVEDAVVLSELLAKDTELDGLLDQFMERRWTRCKLVVEASIQVGDWELRPTPTSVDDSIALSQHVRTTLAHAF